MTNDLELMKKKLTNYIARIEYILANGKKYEVQMPESDYLLFIE
jgi:hypothetical protein